MCCLKNVWLLCRCCVLCRSHHLLLPCLITGGCPRDLRAREEKRSDQVAFYQLQIDILLRVDVMDNKENAINMRRVNTPSVPPPQLTKTPIKVFGTGDDGPSPKLASTSKDSKNTTSTPVMLDSKQSRQLKK